MDDARRESWRATLEGGLIQDRVFASRAEAESEIFWYGEVFHNRVRLHRAPGYESPADFEHNLN